MRIVGFLNGASAIELAARVAALRDGLAEVGHVETRGRWGVPSRLTQQRAREVPVDPRGRPVGWRCASFLCSLEGLGIGCGGCRGRCCWLACFGGFDFAHRWPVEFEAVGVVDDAVQDGVAESELANDLMPGGVGW
jgi:hypothetical protein